jgi:adenylate cyclase
MNEQDERLHRALAAYLRQEVQAPTSAIAEFLDALLTDAHELEAGSMLSDIRRMHEAGLRLIGFVNQLIDDASFGRQQDESDDDFHRRLRHDLRTPLNAIIGYSEMLIEDMEDSEHPLRDDLTRLRTAANGLLGQIAAMVALTRDREIAPEHDADHARRVDILADVLRTLQPLHVSAAGDSVPPSAILIVDDNAANRDVLARRLARDGHRISTAEDGAAALALCDTETFDLILLDLIMPQISGFEVLTRLKADQRTRHVPVIVISALDELDSVVRCIEAGAEDYLTKQFDPVLLRARVNASLERKHLRDREKKFIAELEHEKRRSEILLLNILPKSIVSRMRNGETSIADRIAEATILFCDLVGFTALSHALPADRTIDFLNRIFTAFDRLAAEEGVEKIKTIGDAYMVAAGIPEPQSDHAVRVVRFAFRMLQEVATVAAATDLDLKTRIGIHSGPVVAGVIGTHKFIYDVWGDTVNTASRMESHSVTGRIQVSAATARALAGRFPIEPRGIIDVKGKGPMETFFLLEGE